MLFYGQSKHTTGEVVGDGGVRPTPHSAEQCVQRISNKLWSQEAPRDECSVPRVRLMTQNLIPTHFVRCILACHNANSAWGFLLTGRFISGGYCVFDCKGFPDIIGCQYTSHMSIRVAVRHPNGWTTLPDQTLGREAG